MSEKRTDAQLAAELRSIAWAIRAGRPIILGRPETFELAADRLEAKAAANVPHGTPALTIDEHAHGDDAA